MAKATATITIEFTADHEDSLYIHNIEMGIREAISENVINIIHDDECVSMHEVHFNWNVERN